MLKRIGIACLAWSLIGFPVHAEAPARLQPPQAQPADRQGPTTKEVLTDAAIVAAVIAASIAAYKAMGRPCACPFDTMRNGRACGGNSAHSKPNGYKPLCFPTDITASMIQVYRATKAIPAIF